MEQTKIKTEIQATQMPTVLEGNRFVGSLFDFGKDPLRLLRRAVALQQPVVDFKVPGELISIVTSAEMAHSILVKHYKAFRKADRDVGVMAHVLGNGLVTNNDYSLHKKQRKLAQPGFHFRRIQSYAQTMIDYTYEELNDWADSETRNVHDDMFRLTLYIVSKTLFDSDKDTMGSVSDQIGESIHALQVIMNKGFQSMFVLPSWLPMPGSKKLEQAKQNLISIIQTMIQSRRLPDGQFLPGDDLLSMLLESEYEDGTKMPESLLMEELITLLSAGHETTSNAMTWTFYLLAQYPEIQNELFSEIETVLSGNKLSFEHLDQLHYTEQVVKESMRIFPPAWTLNTRQANEDTVVDGYLFEKDKHVFISPYANHYNPKYFPEPERFDPDRFSKENEAALPRYAYMPFGGGNRVCIGNSFALMESKIILAICISQFRFSLDKKTSLELQPHVTLSNKDGMWLRVNRR